MINYNLFSLKCSSVHGYEIIILAPRKFSRRRDYSPPPHHNQYHFWLPTLFNRQYFRLWITRKFSARFTKCLRKKKWSDKRLKHFRVSCILLSCFFFFFFVGPSPRNFLSLRTVSLNFFNILFFTHRGGMQCRGIARTILRFVVTGSAVVAIGGHAGTPSVPHEHFNSSPSAIAVLCIRIYYATHTRNIYSAIIAGEPLKNNERTSRGRARAMT